MEMEKIKKYEVSSHRSNTALSTYFGLLMVQTE